MAATSSTAPKKDEKKKEDPKKEDPKKDEDLFEEEDDFEELIIGEVDPEVLLTIKSF